MPKPFPELALPSVVQETLPKNAFVLKPLSTTRSNTAAKNQEPLLDALSHLLGFSGEITPESKQKAMSILLAPFPNSIKNTLIKRIERLSQPGILSEDSRRQLYHRNQDYLSAYLLEYTVCTLSENPGYQVLAKPAATHNIPTFFVKHINSFYTQVENAIRQTVPNTAIVDKIANIILENIMLFHSSETLKQFRSAAELDRPSKFDLFVQEKLSALIDYLEFKMCAHSTSHQFNWGSMFGENKAGTQSPTSVATLDM